MRVRHLQTCLREQKMARLSDLSLCRGMRIGIDAIYFFRSLKGTSDPLSDVCGSLSPSFIACVDEQLQAMDKLQIQPLFVFQGMQPRSHLLLSVHMMGSAMQEAWAMYAKGDIQGAISKFGCGPYKELSEETVQLLMNHLRMRGREIVRAPYFSTAQLSYFAQESLVDAIVGPPSILLFGVPRVMISLDLARGTFEWVELDEILSRWGLNKDQFADACLLAGTEHCISYPFLSQNFSFAHVVDCIKQAPLVKYLFQIPSRAGVAEYVDGYCVGKSLVMHPLVMTINGEVAPLFKKTCLPCDYYKIVGIRLPRNLYYLMCEGLISVQVPFALALGEWIDDPNPNADSLEYRDLLQDLREYHCRALGLVVLKLDKSFQNKHIRFPGQVSLAKGHSAQLKNGLVMIPNSCPVKHWNITREDVKRELARQKRQDVSLSFLLRWHLEGVGLASSLVPFAGGIASNGILPDGVAVTGQSSSSSTANATGGTYSNSLNHSLGGATSSSVNSNEMSSDSPDGDADGDADADADADGDSPSSADSLTDLDAEDLDPLVLCSKILLMLLDNLGYFTREGGPTAFGKVLSDSPLESVGLVILEMLKFGIFTGEAFEPPTGTPFTSDLVPPLPKDPQAAMDVKATNLISRLATLCPLVYLQDKQAWLGPVDFDVACFNACSNSIKRSLEYLAQGCLAHLVLDNIVKMEALCASASASATAQAAAASSNSAGAVGGVGTSAGASNQNDPTSSTNAASSSTTSTTNGISLDGGATTSVNASFSICPANVINLFSQPQNYNTLFGVVVKHLLLEVNCNSGNSKVSVMERLEAKFPNCTRLHDEFQRLAEFWRHTSHLVTSLDKLVPLCEALDTFQRATNLLEAALLKVGVDLSTLSH